MLTSDDHRTATASLEILTGPARGTALPPLLPLADPRSMASTA